MKIGARHLAGDFAPLTKEIVSIDTNDEMVYAVIRIPKESKKKIRDQFGLLGMTDSFIFPDDITKVFDGIKDKIGQRVVKW